MSMEVKFTCILMTDAKNERLFTWCPPICLALKAKLLESRHLCTTTVRPSTISRPPQLHPTLSGGFPAEDEM